MASNSGASPKKTTRGSSALTAARNDLERDIKRYAQMSATLAKAGSNGLACGENGENTFTKAHVRKFRDGLFDMLRHFEVAALNDRHTRTEERAKRAGSRTVRLTITADPFFNYIMQVCEQLGVKKSDLVYDANQQVILQQPTTVSLFHASVALTGIEKVKVRGKKGSWFIVDEMEDSPFMASFQNASCSFKVKGRTPDLPRVLLDNFIERAKKDGTPERVISRKSFSTVFDYLESRGAIVYDAPVVFERRGQPEEGQYTAVRFGAIMIIATVYCVTYDGEVDKREIAKRAAAIKEAVDAARDEAGVSRKGKSRSE